MFVVVFCRVNYLGFLEDYNVEENMEYFGIKIEHLE